MDLPVLMTAQAGVFVWPEGMDRPLVTIQTCKLFHIDMPGMARRLIYRDGSLGYVVPMALRTGGPGGS
jgi:hypothetical protein